ncbi:MAG: hypothetical protein ACT4NL_15940 [Pseudomarimonas sp.]
MSETGRFFPVIMLPVLGNSDGEAGQFLWRSWSMLLASDGQFIGNTQSLTESGLQESLLQERGEEYLDPKVAETSSGVSFFYAKKPGSLSALAKCQVDANVRDLPNRVDQPGIVECDPSSS